MDILFEQPVWLIAVCLLVAALLAVFMYRKDRLNRHLSLITRGVLGLFRFVALFLLSLFLLHPLIRTIDREVEDPLVVIVQDDSESIMMSADSSFIRTQWQAQLKDLTEELGEKYEVKTYRFGDGLQEGTDSLRFDEKTTDFSSLFDGLYSRYSNRNLGAIIIASDGIYNAGSDPRYRGSKLNAPVFTIAMGDTSLKRDVRIADVAHNRLAYLGNQFPIEVSVEARKAKGRNLNVSIVHKGKTVWGENFTPSQEYDLKTFRAVLEADESGLQRYTVRVTAVEGEVTTANNQREIFIDVLESRQKVLILAESPHPDVAALKNALSSNLNYEVKSFTAEDYEGDLKDQSLVIFHGIPGNSRDNTQLLTQALRDEIPVLIVFTSATNFNAFNNLKLGYGLRAFNGSSQDVQGVMADGFPYFQVDDETKQLIRNLPPLSVPFGDLESVEGAVHLVNQRIGNISTRLPLISFNQVNGNKVGVITGEGIWRWRMVSHLRTGSHKVFDKFTTSIVQYLANREDRRQFRIDAPRDVLEDERIIFTAEVYNDSYEAITDPEVEITLKDDEGAEFTYVMTRSGSFYRLDAGKLPTGDYTWVARTQIGGRGLSESGSLTIAPVQLEMASTVADHQLLFQLSEESGGQMVAPGEVSSLPSLIDASGEAVAISYERKKLSDMINLPWILALLLALLSIEWLIRKRSGTY